MRAINSTAITAGLMTIPVKVYTAAQSKKVSFCQLTDDLNRVKQQYVSMKTGDVVERPFKRGFEYIKGKKGKPGKSVEITDAELDSLAPKDPSKALEIKEFVKAEALSNLSVEKTYYLGPDDAGEQGYSLFAHIMSQKNVVALAQWTVRGRVQLVAIRPYDKDGVNGLLLQQLFYSDEIRDFSEMGVAGTTSISEPMIDMAGQLIDVMTSEAYDASKYKNEYASKVHALVEKKINGNTIDISTPDAPKKDLADMFAQLQASVLQLKAL
ncbi:hypothetical protein LCGC14_0702150 [marine sediment metagenome]|uniref:Ku domain-containing protein n=1 Tax=marine sediment metagenome TaxID=412755 RepID=A0A0F9TQA6_9ZZZZ